MMWIFGLLALCSTWQADREVVPNIRPNILWITSEDNGPHLGCYGDPDATTPNIDALAQRSLRFENAWSNAPVCAPARTTLITGMYATSLGAHHMRSRTKMPDGFGMFPQLLRKAGYYCSNRSKTDYNVAAQGQVWDQSNKHAHWRGRAAGQPFFSVFNFTSTHESATRRRPHQAVHDPAVVHLPEYYPDLPEIRQDWAQYHDRITVMDRQVGSILKQLDEDGLADSTIVFYFADHGAGFPRAKRWPGNSGMHVPLLVHVPAQFKHLAPEFYAPGKASSELVAFVDFAPTVLSIAGLKSPAHYQGRAFGGQYLAKPSKYLHGFRGRMDERIDMCRSVRDQRYVYVRNYYPRMPHGQHIAYMFQTPTTLAWKAAFDAGTLSPSQASFWQKRAREELYDLQEDPDEVHNLAADERYQGVLHRLRKANQAHLLSIQDLGFLPESEMYARAGETAPRKLGLNSKSYPLEDLMAAADCFYRNAASSSQSPTPAKLDLKADPAHLFWSIQALLNHGEALTADLSQSLQDLLKAPTPTSPAPGSSPTLLSPSSATPTQPLTIQIAAAEALAILGPQSSREHARDLLLDLADHRKQPFFACVESINAMDRVNGWTAKQIDAFAALPMDFETVPRVLRFYLPRLQEHFLRRWTTK